jgi:teichuronic acid biosynthesis glycosyltransferase TuaG
MVENLVSIIMPTYNVGELVKDTVGTVLFQTYSNWELLIIDDCSSDNTQSILQDLASHDSRIKCYFSSQNLGAGSSRNIGLSNSNGQYIAFLDSDDLWEPEKLELQINFMNQKNAPICHTSFSFIDESGEARNGFVNVSESLNLRQNLKRTEIGTSTAMIDRKLVTHDFKFNKIRARQDLKLWIDLLSLGYTSYGLQKELVKYRVRDGSVSSNKFKMLYVTLKVYCSVRSLPLSKRLYYYFFYVFNAIRKRQ